MRDSTDREHVNALETAEMHLQAAVAELARAKRYNDVPAIAEIAARLSALITGLRSAPTTNTKASGRGARVSRNTRLGPSIAKLRNLPADASLLPAAAPNGAAHGYPRFHRQGETLVKVGWSHSKQSKYEHRAPIEAIEAIATKIEDLRKRKR